MPIALLITNCKTTPQIKYIHEIPDVVFPVFPSVDSVTYDDETDLVSMPLGLWMDIAKYKIDVDAIETYIKLLRGEQDVQKMRELKERGLKNRGGMKELARKTKKRLDGGIE